MFEGLHLWEAHLQSIKINLLVNWSNFKYTLGFTYIQLEAVTLINCVFSGEDSAEIC